MLVYMKPIDEEIPLLIELGDTGIELGDTGIELGDTGIELGDTGIELGDTGIEQGESGITIYVYMYICIYIMSTCS